MEQPIPSRDLIRIISRHSNAGPDGIRAGFAETGVYAGRDAWTRAVRIALMALGIGFTAAGVIFFFAYNWNALHKFVRLGIIQGLLIGTVSVVLFARLDRVLKNILLSGASLLVGALFAVYGQIYQTGANAYDFFLGWTAFVVLWAVAAGFPALWLLLLALGQTTLLLYGSQIAYEWTGVFVFLLLFLINGSVVVLSTLLPKIRADWEAPAWFTKTVALAATAGITVSMVQGTFEASGTEWLVACLLGALFFAWGIWYGLQTQTVFYLSVIPLAIILFISSLLVQAGMENPIGMFFLVGAFIIISTTVVIRLILHLNRQWHGSEAP